MKLAIIPARGGSKRIPRKNIRPFLGRPIIDYSIAASRETGLFSRIIVTTDDPEIAEVARDCGAETPFLRPAELSDDYVGTTAVVAHALRWLQEAGDPPTLACCIYATAPFVQARFLAEGHRLLSGSGKSYAFSVTHFEFPIQRALRRAADGSVDAMHPQYEMTRSQDLEAAWHDAGQFYWGQAEAFIENRRLYTSHSLGVAIPREYVQDIDTEGDWVRAEAMYRALQLRPA